MNSHGKDIAALTRAVYAGAAPTITTATERTSSAVLLSAIDERPSSVSFDIPLTFSLDDGEALSVVGHVEKSIDGSTWEAVTDAADVLLNISNDSGGTVDYLESIRIPADIIQSDLDRVRCKFTPTITGTVTVTAGSFTALFGGLDECGAKALADRRVQ